MMNREEVLYLDSNGYQKILKKIDELKKELEIIVHEKGDAYSGSAGDGWHDNFAFDEVNRQERKLLGQLREYYQMLQNAQIVEKQQDECLIDIDDIVTIYRETNNKEFLFKLVSYVGHETNSIEGLKEISINSPLGKAVYHKNVGDNVQYSVEDRVFNIKIISKISEMEFKNQDKNSR